MSNGSALENPKRRSRSPKKFIDFEIFSTTPMEGLSGPVVMLHSMRSQVEV
jgi:hypothetical protein